MRASRLAVLVATIAPLLVGRGSTLSASKQAESALSSGARRALLIGVTKFEDAGMARHDLEGPANDVALFTRVLEGDPFHLAPGDVTILSGQPADPLKRPTRANIEREFRRLRDVSHANDQVIILFAGHGSQQPADTSDPSNYEADGLDEIVLPSDASGWDSDRGTVRNAIVDNDVRRWVTDIRNAGAFVWIIFDSCHSATMTRGGFLEVSRGIPMSELVPRAAIDAAIRRAAAQQEQTPPKTTPLALTNGAGDIAALYAAGLTEETPETTLPAGGNTKQGLFTYTLADILLQSSTPLTYRELAQRVVDRYRALQRFAATPVFEGGGLDREVLGQRTWPERPQMLLADQSSASTWRLNAGSLHGLTPESVLELFPPAGAPDADTHVGYVKVVSANATTTDVTPVAFERTPPPEASRMVSASRGRIAAYSYGDLTLKVALQQRAPGRSGAAAPYVVVPRGAGTPAIESALANLKVETNGLADRVDAEPADWFVRVDGDRVVLVPTSGWQGPGADPGGPPTAFVMGSLSAARRSSTEAPPPCGLPSPQKAETLMPLRETIAGALRNIGRASNLTRMAAVPGTPLPLDVAVTRYDTVLTPDRKPVKDARDQYAYDGSTARPIAGTDVTVTGCRHQLEFRLTNPGPQPIDVTLFYLDAGFGLSPLFPEGDKEIDNRLPPGGTQTVGPFLIDDKLVGWESAVAIGVPATTFKQNFRMLAQPPLDQATRRGFESPLQALLDDAAFGSGVTTRSPHVMPPSNFVVKMMSWRTLPAPK